MSKVKINVTTDKAIGALIKDNRDDRYYFEEEAGMVRNFETVLGKDISRAEAIRKVAKDANCKYDDIEFIN